MLFYWLEAVPTATFPVYVTFCRNNRTESFCILQTRSDFTEDSHESIVILWHVLVESGVMLKVAVYPLAEPYGCALVRLQQECRNMPGHALMDRPAARLETMALMISSYVVD